MRKRISCKVIRTIPLSTNSSELRDASMSNDQSHNISDSVSRIPTTKKYVWEPVTNPQARHACNSVTYTDRLDITRMPIEDGLTAQVLDCYV